MAPSTQSRNSPRGPPSSTTLTLIKILSIVRVATGAACLIVPRFTCAMHNHNVPAEHVFLVRMMGVREGVNGGLLLTAEDGEKADGGRREIRRALWAGIVADSVDICSLAFGFVTGSVGNTTVGIIGTAAVGAISMATLMLRNL